MDFPPSVSSSRMGRPPLKVKVTTIRLPEGVDERIDALVGPHRRAQFIREAVMKELRLKEKTAAARKAKASKVQR